MFKLKPALLLSTCLAIALSGRAAAAPQLGIGIPADGTTVSGLIYLVGWAVDAQGIEKVEVFINGQSKGVQLGYGGSRGDVAAAFPNLPDAQHSGFAGVLSANLLANGPHTLRIVATSWTGQKTSEVRTLLVSNPPGAHAAGTIDLGDASARVSHGVVFLDNVLLDGVAYDNLNLELAPRSRSFVLAAFNDDRNHDGYHDDDLNRDGYHDGDEDFDGFDDSAQDNAVLPGVPLPLAEVKGSVLSVTGTSMMVRSVDPEHGGAVGDVLIDITGAVIDDSLVRGLQIGAMVEVKGSWDGSVLTATLIEGDDANGGSGPDDGGTVDDTVRPGVPLAAAEVKGTVTSITGNSMIVHSTDPEHGGAVGNVTVDISNAVIDDSLVGGLQIGAMVEVKGSWDGSVLTATLIEGDDANGGSGPDDGGTVDDSVRPGVPLAAAEVKGTVTSVTGNTMIVHSTDPEHGGAVGNVTVDFSGAMIDDSLPSGIVVGLPVEAKGSWDGFVLTATFVELDD
jgi:hypothetical protein